VTEDLLAQFRQVSETLAYEHEQLSIDLAAYHRRYWHIWNQAADEKYVTARARLAEYECRDHLGTVITRRGVINGLTVRRDMLLALLWGRGVASSLSETWPLDAGLPSAALADLKE
jgi:phosphoribosylformimino-5-aminoimidazole carboxamide ribonucleotide (ProFAR) isomerase